MFLRTPVAQGRLPAPPADRRPAAGVFLRTTTGDSRIVLGRSSPAGRRHRPSGLIFWARPLWEMLAFFSQRTLSTPIVFFGFPLAGRNFPRRVGPKKHRFRLCFAIPAKRDFRPPLFETSKKFHFQKSGAIIFWNFWVTVTRLYLSLVTVGGTRFCMFFRSVPFPNELVQSF